MGRGGVIRPGASLSSITQDNIGGHPAIKSWWDISTCLFPDSPNPLPPATCDANLGIGTTIYICHLSYFLSDNIKLPAIQTWESEPGYICLLCIIWSTLQKITSSHINLQIWNFQLVKLQRHWELRGQEIKKNKFLKMVLNILKCLKRLSDIHHPDIHHLRHSSPPT